MMFVILFGIWVDWGQLESVTSSLVKFLNISVKCPFSSSMLCFLCCSIKERETPLLETDTRMHDHIESETGRFTQRLPGKHRFRFIRMMKDGRHGEKEADNSCLGYLLVK